MGWSSKLDLSIYQRLFWLSPKELAGFTASDTRSTSTQVKDATVDNVVQEKDLEARRRMLWKMDIHLAILCDLFGMVKWPFEMLKWPPTRGWKGHKESPGSDLLITQMEVTNITPEKVTNQTPKRVTNGRSWMMDVFGGFFPRSKHSKKSEPQDPLVTDP